MNADSDPYEVAPSYAHTPRTRNAYPLVLLDFATITLQGRNPCNSHLVRKLGVAGSAREALRRNHIRKTSYWLEGRRGAESARLPAHGGQPVLRGFQRWHNRAKQLLFRRRLAICSPADPKVFARSEERRVVKECRSRRSP